jgi:hypothetical protein
MTSAPIMWFATCDYEYEKDEETYRKKKGIEENQDEPKVVAIGDSVH